MWIPHTIPKSLLELLAVTIASSDDNDYDDDDDDDSVHRWLSVEELVGEEEVEAVIRVRRIRCDHFGWTTRTPTPLRLRCLDVIAGDFERYNPLRLFETITPVNAAYFAETLDTGLPVPSVVLVPWDEYWRRRYVDRPPNHSPPGMADAQWSEKPALGDGESVRKSYLTRLVWATVEALEPSWPDEDILRRQTSEHSELGALLDACSPHVDSLVCKTLCAREQPYESDGVGEDAFDRDPVHTDVGVVLGRLRNVRVVRLVYGQRFAGRDMDALGRGLVAAAGRLTALAVTNSSGLDKSKFNRLSRYLESCTELVSVDFSGCRLKSTGVASVAQYVSGAAALTRLDLSDNEVGPDGVGALVSATLWRRDRGYPAIELNLNMNRINDVGAKYLASTLATGFQPFTKLQIRNCDISEIGGMIIVQSLAYDRGLRALEIDNNKLSLEVAVALHETMKTNTNITRLSTMNCGFPEKISNFLRNVAFHNRYKIRSQLAYTDIDDLSNELDAEDISLEEASLRSATEVDDSDD